MNTNSSLPYITYKSHNIPPPFNPQSFCLIPPPPQTTRSLSPYQCVTSTPIILEQLASGLKVQTYYHTCRSKSLRALRRKPGGMLLFCNLKLFMVVVVQSPTGP
ncbi:hypothetical protein L873DRAFT_1801931 [Choiromyces venosus 120613-1]|uniref:Uncharacterized protein n=1 Tax=Choiromyces venosus 120613-1 TaxID=1336337 RepID=A0A3N4JWB2_9PEZI|nr:hypothetical protein L873DRAFT_1801931 [Choiromyces venosus 120613-1]